jgi:uncharacterized FAD-dependent dehydrogenase
MSRTLRNIKIGLDQSLEEHLQWLAPGHASFRVLRQSVDARQRHSPHFVYSVEVFEPGEPSERPRIEVEKVSKFSDQPVVIIGAGPAGLFAALRLAERGIACVLLEQGAPTEKRVISIGRFWRYGELNPRTNVGFGEGGAGLFSDGKLITRIKSEHIPYVMQRLVQFGGPPEIEYLANPHVGSDRIRRVIPRMREHMRSLGVDIRFDCKVSEIMTRDRSIVGVRLESGDILDCERVILACGHSADDMFQHLSELGVAMESKPFAVGLRIEHPQELINQIQFRENASHPKLGAANYKLAHTDKDSGLGVYSFCMCPGGYVLSCSTDGLGVVSNGMSNYNRGSRFANAAIVVTVDVETALGSKRTGANEIPRNVFAGLKFRNDLERSGMELVRAKGGGKALPAQTLMNFLDEKDGNALATSSPSGVVPVRLDQLFDSKFKRAFVDALKTFDQNMHGFMSPLAQLHGVESRTSCPLRIPRDEKSLQSMSHAGLYPTGEGAGYAGGITSAACDGIRVAEAIVNEVAAQEPSVFVPIQK